MQNANRNAVRYSQVTSSDTRFQWPRRSNPKPSKDRSWRAPILMTTTLFAGLIVAIAHHLMNHFLNGRSVANVSLPQAWVTRFATAFAFLVQVLFAITTGTAFVQRQWKTFASRPFRLEEIDSLTGGLGNLFNLFCSLVWLRNPVLSIIAIITWLMPIATVITPGSLEVSSDLGHNVTHIKVPQPYYNISNYGYFDSTGYKGPNFTPLHIAEISLLQGQILTSQSRYANQSYSLTFYGPAVKCEPANSTYIDVLTSVFVYGMERVAWTYQYLSWVGGDDHELTNKSGYNLLSSQNLYSLEDVIQTETPRLFVVYNNEDGRYSNPNRHRNMFQNLTECLLYNSSYTVDFSYAFPEHRVTIRSVDYLEPVMPSASAAPKTGTLPDDLLSPSSKVFAYDSMMAALGSIMVGYITSDDYESVGIGGEPWLYSTFTEPTTLHRSVEQLFQNITLSCLSDDTLMYFTNASQRFSITNNYHSKNDTLAEPIPSRITFSQNTYVYKPLALYLAYGLSFFSALACLIVGMHAFHVNTSSYQNTFSTFLRTTRNQELLGKIDRDDDGTDPLPRALKSVKMGLGGN